MALLKIEIVKQKDGSGLLRCTRADGSVTWQKQQNHAAHFALHDLTHYAVETELGYANAFFGLIAKGWEVGDTPGKGTRGPLSPEAIEAERMVGLFDTEGASGTRWTADDFNAFSPRPLAETEIQRIRAARSVLFERWFALTPADKLELTFP